MIESGPPERLVATACIPDGEGGEICATAYGRLRGNGRSWVDCRARARRIAEAAREGKDGLRICERCETNVVVQRGEEVSLLCSDCKKEIDAGEGTVAEFYAEHEAEGEETEEGQK